MVKKITLAHPHGFCAGVTRAIKIVELSIGKYPKPIYMKHQIVHNEHVVKDMENKGTVFVEDINQIPKGSTIILSAHGSSPDVLEEATKRGGIVIDAACPLVKKVHNEAVNFHKKGYSIILIGHKGHQEVIGTMGCAPMTLVSNLSDVDKIEIEKTKIAYLTQTTLSIDDSSEIIRALKKKFPNIIGPAKDDICFATTNRQNAVAHLAKTCDLILVIGSVMSSNSKRLVEKATHSGVVSYLIQDETSIDSNWFKYIENIGVTSGASAPEYYVGKVMAYLQKLFKEATIHNLNYMKEDVEFLLPKELRD